MPESAMLKKVENGLLAYRRAKVELAALETEDMERGYSTPRTDRLLKAKTLRVERCRQRLMKASQDWIAEMKLKGRA